MINYNEKVFKSISNTKNGEVDEQTTFHYFQKGDIVEAKYSGGSIETGSLIAKVDENGNLNMRYHHVNTEGEIMTGKCHSIPEILEDGRIKLIESWEWTSGDYSKGNSIVEEVK